MLLRTEYQFDQRKNFVEENSDYEIVKANEIYVSKKIHPGKETNDDESESSFGSSKKKNNKDSLKRDLCSYSNVLTFLSVP